MTKIEIEKKCRHGHSNHELKVNTVIPIQNIKHADSPFLRDIHNMNKQTDILHVFLPLYGALASFSIALGIIHSSSIVYGCVCHQFLRIARRTSMGNESGMW
jgi:hypothetical protein